MREGGWEIRAEASPSEKRSARPWEAPATEIVPPRRATPSTRRPRRARPKAGPKFAVLGAGHGGLAMAGHLAYMGFRVNLWNRTAERIEHIRLRGGIGGRGGGGGEGRFELFRFDLKGGVSGGKRAW